MSVSYSPDMRNYDVSNNITLNPNFVESEFAIQGCRHTLLDSKHRQLGNVFSFEGLGIPNVYSQFLFQQEVQGFGRIKSSCESSSN